MLFKFQNIITDRNAYGQSASLYRREDTWPAPFACLTCCQCCYLNLMFNVDLVIFSCCHAPYKAQASHRAREYDVVNVSVATLVTSLHANILFVSTYPINITFHRYHHLACCPRKITTMNVHQAAYLSVGQRVKFTSCRESRPCRQPSLNRRASTECSIKKIVSKFYEHVLADSVLQGFYAGVDIQHLSQSHTLLIEYAFSDPGEEGAKRALPSAQLLQ